LITNSVKRRSAARRTEISSARSAFPVLDGLGVAGGGAHTLEEFIFVGDVPKRAALIASLLLAD
jgi:hypothetical protein